MANRLSESDRDRISEFVRTPRYERSPDQLLPDDEEAEQPTDEHSR
jgi:hypothetical protein